MKKMAAGFLAITLIFFASLCWAAYVIHLKDGRNITTHEYWEEADQIKFKQYGGVIGIQKDLINEIEDVGDLSEEKATSSETETPTAKEETGKQKASQDEAKAEETQQEGAAEAEKNKQKAKESDVKNDAKKDPKIMGEFKALEQRFESRKNMPIDLLIELKKELTALRDTIISHYSQEDHREELRKIADMRFFLTDKILRKPKKQ